MTSTEPASILSSNANSKRRRFQPPITSFFAAAGSICESSDGGTSRVSHNNYSVPTYSASPALPHKVQSSLLTVGMRIRKSVPEGYKTEALKPSVYALASSSDGASVRDSPSRTSYAELAPFCGIHKVGNLAVQTFPTPATHFSSRAEQLSTDEGDVFSLPSSSQESTASSIPPPNPHKRSYEEDFENDEDDIPLNQGNNHMMTMGIPSPTVTHVSMNTGGIWQDPLRSNPISTFNSSPSPTRRTILSPKLGQQRRRLSFTSKTSWEQENRDPFAAAAVSGMDVDDFDEPAFLRRREEVDADYLGSGGHEVEMGGA